MAELEQSEAGARGWEGAGNARSGSSYPVALLEPGASCPGARLWIRARSSCGRRRRGRKGDQRDPQPWNCAGSAAGEFSALDPRYPMSLLWDLRSSSGGQNAPQLGSPWRPGSLSNGAYPGPGCERLERWVLPPRSNFTRAGEPPTHSLHVPNLHITMAEIRS